LAFGPRTVAASTPVRLAFLIGPRGRPALPVMALGAEVVAVMEPQEIEDAEHEQVLQRVAAVDVAKASGMVCTRVAHPGRPGRRRTRVWTVAATAGAVLELAGHLAAERIEKVSLESTADYWRIWYYLLEAAGLDVQLVRAHDVKQAPGRPKTGKLDAVWLAKLTERGMLRPSFVTRPRSSLPCGTTPGCGLT
jgi:transposase